MHKAFYTLVLNSPVLLGAVLFYADKSLFTNSAPLKQLVFYALLFIGLSLLGDKLPELATKDRSKRKHISSQARTRIISLFAIIAVALTIFLGSIISLQRHNPEGIFFLIIIAITLYSSSRSFEARKLFGQSAVLWLIANTIIGTVSIALVSGAPDWKAYLAGISISAIALRARLSTWFEKWRNETSLATSSKPEERVTRRLLRLYAVLWTIAPTCFAVLVYLNQISQLTLVLFAILPLANGLISEARAAEGKFTFSNEFRNQTIRLTLLFIIALIVIRGVT